MANDTQSVLQQIKKLLALSQSPNEHEAALAAGKAQELMLRHKLSEADVTDASLAETVSVTEDYVSENIGCFGYMIWKGNLFYRIAKLNNCECVKFGTRLKLIGRESDRQVVEYLCSFLVRELERMAFVKYAEIYGSRNAQRKVFVQNFGLAATHVIVARMNAEKQSFQTANPQVNALVLRDDRAVAAYMGVNHANVRTTKSKVKGNNAAQVHGAQAGHSIQWKSGVGSGNGTRQIGGG